MDIILQLIILLFSVILHEISHGAVANILGDPTAKNEGRLTMNPLKHLDPMGSFLVPLGLFLLTGGSFVFGWAKPVPFNPYFLKNPKRDTAIIGLAGPSANIFLALFFGLLLRFGVGAGLFSVAPGLIVIFQFVILINLLLAFFNLFPVPPLDGSKIFAGILPQKYAHILFWMERYSLILLFALIFFGFRLISPLIYLIFRFIVGA